MKKTTLFLVLICLSFMTYGQSPITEFKETISYWKCDYVSVDYYYLSSNTADCDSVCWDFGDGITYRNSHSNAASHIYNEFGVYTVTLTIWLDGVETQIVKPDLIRVFEAPKALFAYSVSDTTFFSPLQVDFQNQSIKGEGDSVAYSWMIGYGAEPVCRDTNFSYVFDKSGTYEVILRMTDNNGCESQYADYITVKDTAQKGEFEFIKSSCLSETEPSPCGYNKQYDRTNDTLIIYGYYYGNCAAHKTATIRYSGDTVKIKTWQSGLFSTCNCGHCFEIIVPGITQDSIIVTFDGEIVPSTSSSLYPAQVVLNTEESVHNYLQGTWSLTSSCGGAVGDCQPFGSEDKREIEFTNLYSEQDSLGYRIYKQDTIESEGKMGLSYLGEGNSKVWQLENLKAWYPDNKVSLEPIHNDTLALVYGNGAVWDLYVRKATASFIREKEINTEIVCYPNPCRSILFFKTSVEIRTVTLKDLYGKVIKRFDTPKASIDVSNLPSGTYLVFVESGNNVYIQKVIFA